MTELNRTRVLSSLSYEHVQAITAMLDAAPDWEVDLLEDYHGYLAALVSMKTETEGQPCYLISGASQQIELAKLRDDKLQELGYFGSLDDVVASLLATFSE